MKTEVPTDLGVFFELGEELVKVQTGFAKAVAEEAKSQNMKTELITNVSHDLKTPLTSIINYTDLLSKEEIDPDTNGDGVYIEHIYSATYEGYMMVVKDPKKVFVAAGLDKLVSVKEEY